MDGCGLLWMVLGACKWFWLDSGGFQRFTVLVATVKFVALNLKDVDNCSFIHSFHAGPHGLNE